MLPRHITPSIFRILPLPRHISSMDFSTRVMLLPRHITPSIFRSCCSHVILLHLFFDLAAPTSYYSIYFSILLLPRHITPSIFRSCCSHVILLHLFFDLAAPTSYYSIYFSILLLPRHITPSIFRSCCPHVILLQLSDEWNQPIRLRYNSDRGSKLLRMGLECSAGKKWRVLIEDNIGFQFKLFQMLHATFVRQRLRQKDPSLEHRTVYINNFVHTIDSFYARFSPSMILSRSTGVRIVVHSPGTNPLMRKGLSVGPGTETTIKVNSAVRTRLHYPYGDAECTDQTYLPFSDRNLYNFDNCNSVCLQQQYIDACHCLHPYQKYTDRQQRRTNSRICGNLSLIAEPNVSRALRELNCVQSLSVDEGNCTRMCLLPCREKYYDYSGNSAPWPQLPQHMSFYYTYIDGRQHIYGKKFAEYGKIRWDENPETMVDRLKALHLIEDNFLLINVVMQSQFVYMLTDKAQMTWDGVLSSIGGCLSLWLGVTVMTLVEIAEFLFRIGSIYCAKRKHKERAEPTGTAGAGKQIGEFDEFELRVIQV